MFRVLPLKHSVKSYFVSLKQEIKIFASVERLNIVYNPELNLYEKFKK